MLNVTNRHTITVNDEHTVLVIDKNGNKLGAFFFHRVDGEISNVTIAIYGASTFKHVVPTIIYSDKIAKPALLKRPGSEMSTIQQLFVP